MGLGRERSRWKPAWRWLLLACLLIVTAADVLLLGLTTGFLTSGFNTPHLGSASQLAGFLVCSIALDLFLISAAWALLLPVLRALGAPALQSFCLAGAVGAGLPVLLIASRYNIYQVAGGMFNVALFRRFPNVSSSSLLVQLLEEIPVLWMILTVIIGCTLLAAVVAARRLEFRNPRLRERFAPPDAAPLAFSALLFLCIGTSFFALRSSSTETIRFGLERKVSGALLLSVGQRVTDFDADGYGTLEHPSDQAVFDASRHPYAVEIPDNGIDENGVGDDLAGDFRPVEPVAPGSSLGSRRPHVLIIYLESFRWDLIRQHLGDREVVPFLNELAESGAYSDQLYIHSPWTLSSRAQFFGGRLLNQPGEPTLIDDFKELGYTVGHFSGQDESYGGSDRLLGVERADFFYDARNDKDRRTSRSVEPVSLQVGWKVVNERVIDYLEGVDVSKPLFLYVNLVDTHFPYHHDQLDDILGVEPLARGDIRIENAVKVRQAYANTAANVDRAAAQLVAAWRRRIGDADHAILITSDHGQALYEDGYLGHGQSLDDAQTRVSLILWGLGGDWPEPLGPSDIRPLLRRNLGLEGEEETPRARFVGDPSRRILQYAPDLETPWVVALRGSSLIAQFDFRTSRLALRRPDGASVVPNPRELAAWTRDVLWNWEFYQRRKLNGEGGEPR